MKTKIKNAFLMVAVSALIVSCGKGNSSSSGGKGGDVSGVKEFTENTVSDVSIQTIQSKFNSLNTASNGAQAGAIVYHVGPYYMGLGSSSSFNFQVSGCLNLIFTQIGDCNTGYSAENYWRSIIDSGSYKVIKSVSTTSNSYERLTDVDGNDLYYTAYSFSKNASLYKSMLDLDSSGSFGYGATPTKGSVAEVTLTNGQKIEAYLVEKFDGYYNYKYVVSPQLPLMANPVAILDRYGNFLGALKGVGNTRIKQVRVNFHVINYGGQVVPGGYNYIMLN